MTGGEYATAYRRFISQCPVYLPTFFVATGPRGHSADADVGWTESFFAGLRDARGLGVRVDGFALHYYTDFRQTTEDGARFDAKGWYAVLHKGAHIETVINQHWEIMGKYDPEHRTRLVIDEWGNWIAAAPSSIYPRNSRRRSVSLSRSGAQRLDGSVLRATRVKRRQTRLLPRAGLRLLPPSERPSA
jgi:alpha-L-arabinofuranosidase